jgi:hypothetical protein
MRFHGPSRANDLGSFVLTLLAERRQGDDLSLPVEEVGDAAGYSLAAEPQFV